MREKKRQNAKRYYGLSPFRREKIVEYIINHYHIDRTTGQIAVHFGVTPAAISNQVKNLRQEGFEFPPKPTAIQMTLNKLKQK
jgi:DNA-binding MarR family transcriptional regulator